MGERAIVVGCRRAGKTVALQMLQAGIGSDAPSEHVAICNKDPNGPPDRLSLDPNSEDFHPSYIRVGVRVDGVERNDLQFYDVKKLEYMTTANTSHLAESIEPYWRYSENRQMRRARLRWEGKRK